MGQAGPSPGGSGTARPQVPRGVAGMAQGLGGSGTGRGRGVVPGARPSPGTPLSTGHTAARRGSGTDKGRAWGTTAAGPQSRHRRPRSSRGGGAAVGFQPQTTAPPRSHRTLPAPLQHRPDAPHRGPGPPVLTMHSRTLSWKSCSRTANASCSTGAMLRPAWPDRVPAAGRYCRTGVTGRSTEPHRAQPGVGGPAPPRSAPPLASATRYNVSAPATA